MGPLTFEEFAEVNRARVEHWHPGFPDDGWVISDWSNADCGELGELAEVMLMLMAALGNVSNMTKKLRRVETGLTSKRNEAVSELMPKIKDEIGDVATYLDLLAQKLGLRLVDCMVDKFNAVSKREGYPQRILS